MSDNRNPRLNTEPDKIIRKPGFFERFKNNNSHPTRQDGTEDKHTAEDIVRNTPQFP